MTQASKRRQLESKEGWLKAGAKTSTQEQSEGIISHMGETPSWWLVSPFRLGVFPLLVHLHPLRPTCSDVQKTLRMVRHGPRRDGGGDTRGDGGPGGGGEHVRGRQGG